MKREISNTYTGKRVLVTGGAGFIGSNLVDALLVQGALLVRVLDNFTTGDKDNLISANKIGGKRFEIIIGDIRNLQDCNTACEGIDIVFHQAALVSVPSSMSQPILNNDININGTLNILIAASSNRVSRFVYASSAAVYGDEPTVPKIETMSRHYPSPYALSKGINEDYAALYAYKSELGNGLECVGLRYFNVFGPRQNPYSPYSGVISIFADRIKNGKEITIFGDGNACRDFVFVTDVVQSNLLAGLSPMPSEIKSVIYNVGTGKTTTINELVEIIQNVVGKKVKLTYGSERPGDIKYSYSSIEKIKSTLGYNPSYSVEEGLRMLL